MVLNGMSSLKERANESERVMRWGFREFDNYSFFKQYDKISNANVWMGQDNEVPLILSDDVLLTVKKNKVDEVKLVVKHKSAIVAPIKKGDKVAKLEVTMPNNKVKTYDLLAGKDVEELGFFGRIIPTIKYIISGVKNEG